MASDLFLVAHKVCGEPAFDIATRMECPECHGLGCLECDDLGYWWIVPTSGHRAYPYDSIDLLNVSSIWINELAPMPADLPDHYAHSTAPRHDRLAALLAALPPTPPVKQFKRRF